MGRVGWHKLKENKRTSTPSLLLFYDTETNVQHGDNGDEVHTLKLWTACFVRLPDSNTPQYERWFKGFTVKEFWDMVEGLALNKKPLHIFSHNQNFDFIIVDGYREPLKRGWKLKRFINEHGCFWVEYVKGSRKLKILDTTNFFNISVEKLGETLGLPKLQVDFSSCSMEELEEYCRRDVEIIKRMFLEWLRFIKENDLGGFAETIARQAFNAFRHIPHGADIFIHKHPDALNLEVDSYRGGRTEAFFIGRVKEGLYKLDVNSLYPSVMISNDYPVKLVKYVKDGTVSGLIRALNKYAVIARVRIQIDKPAIGVKKGKLIFPVGVFNCVLTSPELEYVLKHGKILNVYEYAIYEKAPIFTNYVSKLYGLREKYLSEGNRVWAFLAKMLLNSLYGKFGQRVRKELVLKKVDPDIFYSETTLWAELGRLVTVYCVGGKMFILSKEREPSFDSFPAIASFVTAYARLRIWNLIEIAGPENVYYCDTDSLFVNEEGFRRLKPFQSGTKLGFLKVEGYSDNVEIYGLKDYVYGMEVKIKGIRKDAKPLGVCVYSQKQFLKLRSLLRLGIPDRVLVREIIKRLERKYDKGVISESGRVEPYRLDENVLPIAQTMPNPGA